MKRLISIILSAVIIFASVATVYAEPTIEYVFNAVNNYTDGGTVSGDGRVYTYIFGSIDNSDSITDMGLKITNKYNEREYAKFSELNFDGINSINSDKKYGFAIDSCGLLNDTFTVKPYYETEEETVEGASYKLEPKIQSKVVIEEGSVGASADSHIRAKDGAISSSSAATSPTGTIFQIHDHEGLSSSQAQYSGIAVMRFDISEVNMDASDIVLKFGTRCANAGVLSIVNNENFELTVRKVEEATQDWTDDCDDYAGYATITGGTRKNSDIRTDVADNSDSIIATINDMDIQGQISGYKGASSSSGYIYFYADITEFVKSEKANGKNSITLAIKGENVGTTLYTYTREYQTYPNQKVYLTWK